MSRATEEDGYDEEQLQPDHPVALMRRSCVVNAVLAFFSEHDPERAADRPFAERIAEATWNHVAHYNRVLQARYRAELDMSIVNAWRSDGGGAPPPAAAAAAEAPDAPITRKRHPLEPPS